MHVKLLYIIFYSFHFYSLYFSISGSQKAGDVSGTTSTSFIKSCNNWIIWIILIIYNAEAFVLLTFLLLCFYQVLINCGPEPRRQTTVGLFFIWKNMISYVFIELVFNVYSAADEYSGNFLSRFSLNHVNCHSFLCTYTALQKHYQCVHPLDDLFSKMMS